LDPANPQVLERPVGQDGAARLGLVALLGGRANPLPTHRTLLKPFVQLEFNRLEGGGTGPSLRILEHYKMSQQWNRSSNNQDICCFFSSMFTLGLRP